MTESQPMEAAEETVTSLPDEGEQMCFTAGQHKEKMLNFAGLGIILTQQSNSGFLFF